MVYRQLLVVTDRLIGQPECRQRGHNRPQVLALPTDSPVIDVSVGADYTLVLTDRGDVWGWGNNGDGQVGVGHTGAVREPCLVPSLSDRGVKQIAAGKTHSAAWTCPAVVQRAPGVSSSVQLGRPDSVPSQYSSLAHCSVDGVRARLKLLHHFSDLIYSSWRLFNLIPAVSAAGHFCLSCLCTA